MKKKPDVIILAGATASGKSGLAHLIARECGGEIISADSMKVYRGADIGTSKPSAQLRSEVKYHLLDTASPDERVSAGFFYRDACILIEGMSERGVLPVVAGGTALYVTKLVEGLADIPPVPPEITAELEKKPVEELYAELQRVDPERSLALHPNMKKRAVRALGVYLATGKKMSELLLATFPPPYNFIILTIEWEREALYERINRRVDRMFEKGLPEEVRSLLDTYGPGAPVFEGVGYREFLPYFLRNEGSLKSVSEEIKQSTRNYAKSQLIWWRRRNSVNIEGGKITGLKVLT